MPPPACAISGPASSAKPTPPRRCWLCSLSCCWRCIGRSGSMLPVSWLCGPLSPSPLFLAYTTPFSAPSACMPRSSIHPPAIKSWSAILFCAFDPFLRLPLKSNFRLHSDRSMPLRLFNTLSGKIEEFVPLEDRRVRMYACGPTVYDYGHIGNFRTFVAVDVLHRFLRQEGYQVRHVMNITDVDDKIIRNSAQAGVSVREYTRKYEQAFLEDIETLSIERPELVRATDH